jgi:hypothetical protein
MSSPESESAGRGSSAQPGATVEGGDVPLQEEFHHQPPPAYELTPADRPLDPTELPPAYSPGSRATQTEFREKLYEIEQYAENDERSDLATLRGMTEIEQLTESGVPGADEIESRARYDVMDDLATEFDVRKIREQLTASQAQPNGTGIREELYEIEARARRDAMDHLASQRGMTEIEQLTESGAPDADDRQARIIKVRERLQFERDTREANTAGKANDIDLSLGRSSPAIWGS